MTISLELGTAWFIAKVQRNWQYARKNQFNHTKTIKVELSTTVKYPRVIIDSKLNKAVMKCKKAIVATKKAIGKKWHINYNSKSNAIVIQNNYNTHP